MGCEKNKLNVDNSEYELWIGMNENRKNESNVFEVNLTSFVILM